MFTVQGVDENLKIGYLESRKLFIDSVIGPIVKHKGVTAESYVLRLILESAYHCDPFNIINQDLSSAGLDSLSSIMDKYDDVSIGYNR